MVLACRAPSLHNSQPWCRVAEGATLHLWADPRRLMPASDHTGRELMLSCGAVLDHLRVAIAAAGWESITERFPNQDEPDHLAILQFRPMETVTKAHQLRADAIRRRRTDRLPLGAPAHGRLQSSYAARWSHMTCCWTWWPTMSVLSWPRRPSLPRGCAVTTRPICPNCDGGLRRWSRMPPMCRKSLWCPPQETPRVDVARAFPPAGGGQRRATIDHDRSKILVLSTPHDDAPLDVLRCGEALSAVLLECTMAGMATCTLTHMTE